jgi:ABC-type multidrug transport system fused ATPase/permease subunit
MLAAPDPAVEVVRFERVSFSYPGRSEPVLAGFELELRPGEVVALVGASGAGKSTVADLLLRLADPQAGRITVGGVDLAGCRADSWREQLAWVPQRPAIVRGTVADNIRLADPSASDDRVREAAELAGADVFVRRLPDEYRTGIGDGGRPLSAGERRRIALARAFLRSASLVVLDEPTADLDDESAEIVAEAIERHRPGRTVLVVAHRPELVRHADRVVRLEAGRAVELAQEVAA